MQRLELGKRAPVRRQRASKAAPAGELSSESERATQRERRSAPGTDGLPANRIETS
jgi:hypothetical protein